jgi:hypothetical protein
MPVTMIRCSIALALLAASLSGCSEDDSLSESSAVNTPSWSQAGRPAPAPSTASQNPLVTDALSALQTIGFSGTFENVGHATGNNNGQLTGAVALAYRYTFSSGHAFDSCVTERLVVAQRYKDSGTYTIQNGTIRLEAQHAGTSIMTFEHDSSFQSVWLDGKKFNRVRDGKLCD